MENDMKRELTALLTRELTALLNWWHFPTGTYATLAATGEGLALIANLVNFSAKVINERYYDLKPQIVNEAAAKSNHSFYDDDQGIVYIETAVGQVSFHMFEDEGEVFNPLRTVERWSGKETQFRAIELIEEFLEL